MSQLANRIWLAVSLVVLTAFAYHVISDMYACSRVTVHTTTQEQTLEPIPAAGHQQPSADEIVLLLKQAQATRRLISLAAASGDSELAAVATEFTNVGWKSYVQSRTRAGYRPDDSRSFSMEVSEAWHACSKENASKLVHFRLAEQGKISSDDLQTEIERNRVYKPLGLVRSKIVLPEP